MSAADVGAGGAGDDGVATGGAGAGGGGAAIPGHARPALGRGFRFQWEPAQKAHVLLYPEGMVKLNGSAGEIMKRCDGVRTVADIVADLGQTRADNQPHVASTDYGYVHVVEVVVVASRRLGGCV